MGSLITEKNHKTDFMPVNEQLIRQYVNYIRQNLKKATEIIKKD
jgi:hypothetical protein